MEYKIHEKVVTSDHLMALIYDFVIVIVVDWFHEYVEMVLQIEMNYVIQQTQLIIMLHSEWLVFEIVKVG